MNDLRRIVRVFIFLLFLAGNRASADTVTFTFEDGKPGPSGTEYGSSDPQGFSALVRDGFVVDVAPSGAVNSALHWHELDSLGRADIPDRPIAERGILARDSIAGQDPLFFKLSNPTSEFILDSLVVGTAFTDGSQTTAVRTTAYRGGNALGSVDLTAPRDSYTSYTGADLGILQGLSMDRLEFIGLAPTTGSNYFLDNVQFRTTNTVPEPGALALFSAGLVGGLALCHRKLRR